MCCLLQVKKDIRFPFPIYRRETGNELETKLETRFPKAYLNPQKWKRYRNRFSVFAGNAVLKSRFRFHAIK